MHRAQLVKAVGTKIIEINDNTDTKQQLIDFVVDRFKIKVIKRRGRRERRTMSKLCKHGSKRLLNSTTYFLINHKHKRYYLENNIDIE